MTILSHSTFKLYLGLVVCINYNTYGSANVDKLITIDTPHYGSNLAYPSTIALLEGHTLGMSVPLDVELRPNSSLFTGQKLDTNGVGVFKVVMGSKAKEGLFA